MSKLSIIDNINFFHLVLESISTFSNRDRSQGQPLFQVTEYVNIVQSVKIKILSSTKSYWLIGKTCILDILIFHTDLTLK